MRTARASRPRDVGASLVEILVAVVLMGTAGVAVLGALTASARGASVNSSQAGTNVWLQSASDYLAQGEYESCTPGSEAAVTAAYRSRLTTTEAPTSPLGWPQDKLSITQVRFWNGSAFGGSCDPTYHLQEITLHAKQPNGTFEASLVMVIGDSDV